MITVTLRQLEQSWPALTTLVSQRMPSGAFRLNLRNIYEQVEPQYTAYLAEITGIFEEFECPKLAENSWALPADLEKRELFRARTAELFSIEVMIEGYPITEQQLIDYDILLSPHDEMMLAKWLIIK